MDDSLVLDEDPRVLRGAATNLPNESSMGELQGSLGNGSGACLDYKFDHRDPAGGRGNDPRERVCCVRLCPDIVAGSGRTFLVGHFHNDASGARHHHSKGDHVPRDRVARHAVAVDSPDDRWIGVLYLYPAPILPLAPKRA